MKILYIILPIVLMALFLGYSIYVTWKRKAGMPAAFRTFFERTGYRYADILDAPLERHVMHGEELMRNASKGYHIHMVRDFYGMPSTASRRAAKLKAASGLSATAGARPCRGRPACDSRSRTKASGASARP